METYSEYRKKKQEGGQETSSKQAGGTYGEYVARKRIGLDTLESDLNNLNTTLSNVYSGWQTPETMQNAKASIEAMQNRLNNLKTYQNKYGTGSGFDVDSLLSSYQPIFDNWDNLTSTYGYFENADAFDKALQNAQFKEDFSGLSYDEVQKKKSRYAVGSDEYNFLNEYGVNAGYSNLDDYDAELAALLEDSDYKDKLTEARNIYALDKKFDKYAHYMDAEDFEESSQYVSTKNDSFWSGLTSQYGLGYNDLTYEYINNQNDIREEIKSQASIYGRDTGDGTSSMEKKGYDKLNDDEIAVYNSIYAKEGKEAAQAFLDDMEVTLTKRVYDEETGRWKGAADNAVLSAAMSALSVPANLAGAFTGTVESIRDKISGKEYNPYSYNKTLSNFSTDTRQYVGENIEEATEGMNLLGQNIPSFLYQTGMSMADSATIALTGGAAGSVLLGSSAAQQKAKELKEAGATEEQVLAGSLTAGAFEMLFEKISLDKLLKNKNADSAWKIVKEALKQAGVEGSEEMLTETANLVTDVLLRGQNSDALERYNHYLERGFSEKDAGWKIVWEDLGQIAMSGVGGALSGGIMGGAAATKNHHDLKNTGAYLKENNLAADVWETAGMSAEEMETLKLYEQLAKKNITVDNISDAKLGNLYNTMNAEVYANNYSQATNDVIQIAAHRLAEQGYKGTDIMELAEAVVINSESRTKAQKRLIENSGLSEEAINSVANSYELNEGYRPSEKTLKSQKQVYRMEKLNAGEVVSDKKVKARAGEILEESPDLSSNEALLAAHAEGMDEAKKKVFMDNSEGITDVDEYAASFNLVYEYGRSGFGADTALNNRGVLTLSQTSEIYKAGIKNKVAERQKNVDAITAKYAADNNITAGTFDDTIIDYDNKGKGVNWNTLTTAQRGAISLAKTLSKATGINITLIESKVNSKGKYEGASGSYNPVTNTIELDINSGRFNVGDMESAMVSTLSHETTHWMKDKAPELYQQLTDIVMDTLSNSPDYTIGSRLTRENIIHKEMDRIQRSHPDIRVTEEYAVDELVARACEDMLSNSKTAQEYLEQLPEEERKSLYKKIKDAIDKLKQWISDLLGQYSSKSKEAQILREYKDKLDALQNTWDKAFKAAVTANQALQKEGNSKEESVQYSDRAFAEDIKEWAREGKPDNEIFILGTTGDVLQGLGAIESDIYMHGDKIKTILEEHPEITLEEIKKIPSILENPVMVLESKNVGRKGKMNSRLVLFGSVKAKNGNPMLVVLDLRPMEKHLVIDDLQKVTSAYTKTEAPKIFLENSNVMYLDKKRTTSLLRTMGFFAPIELNESGYIGNIAYIGQKVKLKGKSFQDVIKYADDENVYYQDRDSEGSALSRGQIKYFKNSKVRDAKGRLVPLYHQTDSEFTVFDVRAQGAGASDNETPFGIFLKGSDKDIGLNGRKQMKLYANITNPLYAKDRSELKEQLISLSPTYAELTKQHQGLDSLYKEKFERAKKELTEYMTTWRKQNPNASRTALYEDEKFNKIYNAEDEVIEEWGNKADSLTLEAKEAIVKALRNAGYDGIILGKDEGSFGRITDAYIALDPNQVKDINNTNPTENVDIRYQDRFTDDFYELFAEGNTTEKESEVLGEDLLRLADVVKMTGKKAYTDALTAKVARFIRTEYSSNYDVNMLATEISKVYDYIANAEDLQWNDVMNVCYELAGKVLAEQKGKKASNDYAKMILKDIKNTAIRLNNVQAEEAKSTYGSDYRFLLGSRIKIDSNGIALARQWQQWSEQYPDIFDAGITGAEQITALVDLCSDLTDVSETVQHFNDSNTQRQVALEIYNKFWTLQTESIQGKYEMDIKKLKAEHRKAMSDLKIENAYAERWYDAEAKAKYGELVKEIRDRKDAEIQGIKTNSKKRMDEYRDRVQKNTIVERITRNAVQLNKRFVTNSKNLHIPEVMKPAVAHLLSAIDFSSKQLLGLRNTSKAYTPTKRDVSLSKALEEVREVALEINNAEMTMKGVESAYEGFVGFPPTFIAELEKQVKDANNIVRTVGDNQYILNEMNLEQLESLDKIVTVIKHICTEIDTLHSTRTKVKMNAAAQDSIQYMEKMGERNTFGEGMKSFFTWTNLSPIYAFKRFGRGGEIIFEALQDAQDKYAFMAKEIKDYTDKLYEPKEVIAWSKEILEFEVLDKTTLMHKKIRMPVTHAMSLYCLSKRKQGLKHILGGGVRVEDFKEGVKKVSQVDGFTLGKAELEAICNALTDKQRTVADGLQKFLNTTCAKWGNETSMMLYGIKCFTEKNYFPIRSEDNGLHTDGIPDTASSIYKLLNMSFTKQLNLEAKNTIMVRNIFDVFAEHSSNMAAYNTFGPAVLDACRWYNYKENRKAEGEDATQNKDITVKGLMETAYGPEAKKYVEKFLRDINGDTENVSGMDRFVKRMMGNYKKAAVGANIRVSLLQPTAYVRAATIINPKYLLQGLKPNNGIQKAKEHCGIALWKSMGFYDTNISRGLKSMIKHDETRVDKLVEKSLELAGKMDEWTWGCLWNACEAEIKDKQPSLKPDSEAYQKAVSDRLREIIYKTQVVDSVMTRTQSMRDKSAMAQTLTAFMSEALMSYNMVLDAAWDFMAEKRATGKSSRQTRGKMVRVFSTYIVTAGASALAGALADAVRDDDDEKDFGEAYMEALIDNFVNDLNPLGKLPVLKDIVSIKQGFQPSRMDEQVYLSAVYALNAWEKLMEGEGSVYKAVYRTAQTFSQATGIPVSNLFRDVIAIWNKTIGEVYPSLKLK